MPTDSELQIAREEVRKLNFHDINEILAGEAELRTECQFIVDIEILDLLEFIDKKMPEPSIEFEERLRRFKNGS